MDDLRAQLNVVETINTLEQLRLESLRLEHASMCLNDGDLETITLSIEGEYSQEHIGRYIKRMIQASKNIASRVTRNVKEKLSYLTSGIESLDVHIATAEYNLNKYQNNKAVSPTTTITGGAVLHVNSKLSIKEVVKGLKATQQTYGSIYDAYLTYASKMVDHIKRARTDYQKLDEETTVERSAEVLKGLSDDSTKIHLELKDKLSKLSKVVISGDHQIVTVDRVISTSNIRTKPRRDEAEEIRIVKRLDVKNRNRAGRYADTQEVATATIKELSELIQVLRPMLSWYRGLDDNIDKILVDLGTLKELADGSDTLVYDFKWSDDDPMAIIYKLYFGSGIHTWISVIEEGIMSILPYYFKVLYSGTNYAVSHLKSYQEDPNDDDSLILREP